MPQNLRFYVRHAHKLYGLQDGVWLSVGFESMKLWSLAGLICIVSKKASTFFDSQIWCVVGKQEPEPQRHISYSLISYNFLAFIVLGYYKTAVQIKFIQSAKQSLNFPLFNIRLADIPAYLMKTLRVD